MHKTAKIAQVEKGCVACGCCTKVCPKGAIHVESGITARVNTELCVGCGKCARECPAGIILITEREERK